MTRVFVIMWLCLPVLLHGQASTPQQQPSTQQQSAITQQTGPLDNELAAGDEDNPRQVRELVKWNHFEGKYASVVVGRRFFV